MLAKSVIIGGDKICVDLLKFLETLPYPFLEIIGVVDSDLDAPGILYAQRKGIPISKEYKTFLKNENLDIIIDLRKDTKLAQDILKHKLPETIFIKISDLKPIENIGPIFQKLVLEKEEPWFFVSRYETIGTMVSGIAHEFNNLLMIIMGYAQLISMQIGEESTLFKHLTGLINACNKAHSLIDQLLIFARQSLSEKRKLSLTPLVKETAKLLQKTLPENITIHLEASPTSFIEADPTQIQQLIFNLAANSSDAMPEGGNLYIKVHEVEVTKSDIKKYPFMTPGRYVYLSVKDTGIGIPKEIQPRIFDPFFTTKGPDKGTGMGLAIAYGIVKQSKGYILVESEPKRGSEFKVYFPIIKEDIEEKKIEIPLKKTGKGVLIVEDEPEILKVCKEFLEELGYKVFQASDGEEGWNVFKQKEKEISLVITDIVMPKMSGIELGERVKTSNPNIKLILMTGYDPNLSSSKKMLADEIINKPFSTKTLAERIQNLIDDNK
ncbi:MAG: response regulator [Candidatus Desulfofervidaceae bacterium]|nr:response regulator [Candidatus Desulfofervidaceae bacterium]